MKRIGSVLNAATGHAHSQLSYDVINAAVAGAKQRVDLKGKYCEVQSLISEQSSCYDASFAHVSHTHLLDHHLVE